MFDAISDSFMKEETIEVSSEAAPTMDVEVKAEGEVKIEGEATEAVPTVDGNHETEVKQEEVKPEEFTAESMLSEEDERELTRRFPEVRYKENLNVPTVTKYKIKWEGKVSILSLHRKQTNDTIQVGSFPHFFFPQGQIFPRE